MTLIMEHTERHSIFEVHVSVAKFANMRHKNAKIAKFRAKFIMSKTQNKDAVKFSAFQPHRIQIILNPF